MYSLRTAGAGMTAEPRYHGVSKLDPEQQDWMQERYGLRYLYVQEQIRPNRKERRKAARATRLRGR